MIDLISPYFLGAFQLFEKLSGEKYVCRQSQDSH